MSSEGVTMISDYTVIIFSWFTFGAVCQAINVFGIVTNIINIICFVKQGFEDSVNVSLLGLAISDLVSLISMVWTCISFTPAVVAADLDFDPNEVCYLTSAMIHFAFTRVSGCLTAMITVERCLCITSPLKVKDIITTKRSAVITVCLFIIFVISGAPVYAVNRLDLRFSASRNRTLYGLVSTENRENVEKFTFAINSFVIPFAAFVIIVVCTAILSFKLRTSIKWRQKTITSTQVDRVSSRNMKTATMVVVISILFIVCFVPISLIVLAMGLIPELSIHGKYVNISILIGGVGHIMESINSSMNIFIYYHMSSRYRDNFLNIFRNTRLE